MTCTKVPGPDDPINTFCSECGHITGYHIPRGCELCRIPEIVNQYLAAHVVEDLLFDGTTMSRITDALEQELLERARAT